MARGGRAAGARRSGRAPARSPVSRLLAALAAAVLVVAAGCGGDDGKPGTDREPTGPKPPFFGVVAEDVLAGDADYRRAMLARQRAAGVRLIRQTFHWDRIEPSPGRYDFREYDAYVTDVARAGIDLLPILFTPPPFRADGRPERGTYPPDRPQDMGEFAVAPRTALRPRRAVLGVPPRSPVPPDPRLAGLERAEPAGLLAERARPGRVRGAAERGRPCGIKRGGSAARRGERRPQRERQGIPFEEFVRGMFDAGADDALDVFALHAFARDAAGSVAAARRPRGRCSRELDSRAPIWITEIGWASGGPASPFTSDEQGQAERIRAALDALFRRRERARSAGRHLLQLARRAGLRGRPGLLRLAHGTARHRGQPKARAGRLPLGGGALRRLTSRDLVRTMRPAGSRPTPLKDVAHSRAAQDTDSSRDPFLSSSGRNSSCPFVVRSPSRPPSSPLSPWRPPPARSP